MRSGISVECRRFHKHEGLGLKDQSAALCRDAATLASRYVAQGYGSSGDGAGKPR